MKEISERSSSEPAPRRTAKRAPASFEARSKSRMPSASPSSQCGFGLKGGDGTAPTTRSTRLSVSSRPTGTDSWGMFGISLRRRRSERSVCLSRSS